MLCNICNVLGLQSAITVQTLFQPSLQLHPWQACSSMGLSQLPGEHAPSMQPVRRFLGQAL